MIITRNFFELVIRLLDLKLFTSSSYFFALMQKSKQKKSSQKKPACRTGGRFPVFWRAVARDDLRFGFQSYRF